MPKHDTINCNTKCPPQVNNSLYTSSADFPPNCFLGYAFIYFSIFLIYALLHFPISVPFLIKRRMNLLLFSLLPPLTRTITMCIEIGCSHFLYASSSVLLYAFLQLFMSFIFFIMRKMFLS